MFQLRFCGLLSSIVQPQKDRMVAFEYLLLVAVFAVIVKTCHQLNYWLWLMLYAFALQLVCFIPLPVAIFRRRNPDNFKIAGQLMSCIKRIFGIHWKLVGRENIKRKAYVIVSNHQSSIDLLGMLVNWEAFHPVVPVMKSELRFAFAFGLFSALSGAIFVARGSGRGSDALQNAIDHVTRTNTSIWIFPEGTRNRTQSKTLLPFRRGIFRMAIQSRLPILPVVISDYGSFYNRSERRFGSGSASLTVLPEISTEELSLDDVVDVCDLTQKLMLDALNGNDHAFGQGETTNVNA